MINNRRIIILVITFILSIICFYYSNNKTKDIQKQKEPEEIRFRADRMKKYMVTDVGIVYIEPVEHKLRNWDLLTKFSKRRL